MKKKLVMLLTATMVLGGVLAGCGSQSTSGNTEGTQTESTESESTDAGSDQSESTGSESGATGDITVVSREDGSGTRGAFVELFGIEQEDENGEDVDMTTDDAEITNNTSVMMTTVASDPSAIGYISLGSLNDTVQPVSIDGAQPSAENVGNGSYKIVRPFNIVTGQEVSAVAQDFIDYILSAEGQAVVADNGYISVGEGTAYAGSAPEGKVVVAGSSSVTPVMEKLKEAYAAVNPNAEIEVQQSDSTTGVNSTVEGICDIGMASRDIKDSELESGVTGTVIAQDGIAVITNLESGITELTSEQVQGIYTGEITTWDEI